jgi:hypothetical protein
MNAVNKKINSLYILINNAVDKTKEKGLWRETNVFPDE